MAHDRGAVLRDVAVTIADGGRDISDVVVLREQARMFGPVASVPTVWPSLDEIDKPGLQQIMMVRHKTRRGCGS